MSKIISLLMGSWITYCFMIHSYDGAIALLVIYIFNPIKIDWRKLFTIEFDNKKGTTTTNSRAQK
jgi:hypothetical protein